MDANVIKVNRGWLMAAHAVCKVIEILMVITDFLGRRVLRFLNDRAFVKAAR